MTATTRAPRPTTASMRKRQHWLLAALVIVVPFVALEGWVRARLFEHVSYSNSRSLDASWRALNASRDWSILYIGDSEVRWGFDPDVVDRELARAGIASHGFNMGVDGFSGALSAAILRHLDLERRMPRLRLAVIGTQLMEAHRAQPIERYGDLGCDGALQRPIFSSPMARDLGFAALCQRPHWTNGVVGAVESVSAIVRYRQALRNRLLERDERSPSAIAFNSNALPHRANGFQPHKPIREDLRNFEQAWTARQRDIAANPRMRGPLDAEAWPRLIAAGGYFDRWADMFLARGVLPIFVALPTNPVLIDLMQRRHEYAHNSSLLKKWEARRGDVVFLDLGIKDDYEVEGDFADFRHLSIHGARRFSSELGARLAGIPLIRKAVATSAAAWPLTGAR
jgi:hypothetical protein